MARPRDCNAVRRTVETLLCPGWIVLALLLLAAGVAHACPSGTAGPAGAADATDTMAVSRSLADASPAAVRVAARPTAHADLDAARRCCAGNGHPYGHDCLGGFCPACSSVIDGTAPASPSLRKPVPLALLSDAGANSMKPPPNFRPPAA